MNNAYPKTSLAINSAYEAIGNLSIPVITGANIGRGRFSSSKSWTAETIRVITSMGYRAKAINVAPRGGKHGERVIAYE
jgi:hypothetical protein